MISIRLGRAAALVLAISCFIPAGPLWATEVTVGAISVFDPWTRATPPGAKVAGGFVTIRNAGSTADRLIAGSADFAGETQLHEMSMEGDVMRMRQIAGGVEIPPGAEVSFKPGALHLMFMDLTRPLSAGETAKGTLTFEKAGTVAVEWSVEAPGAKGAHSAH